MDIPALAALAFLPFVLPLCFYTCYTDLAFMRITNQTVVALALVFAIVGVFVLPLSLWLWGFAHLAIVLVAGMVLNAAGVFGAGDAKFAAAAAPFVQTGDLRFVLVTFAACLAGAVVAHRLVAHTRLRRLAPDWKSWEAGKKFPMGLALGPALAIYLVTGALFGSA